MPQRFGCRALALTAASLAGCVLRAHGHGVLIEPKARNQVAAEAGREGCPHCLQGGGPATVQARANGVWPTKNAPGSHGLCGDPGQGLPIPASPAEQKYMVPTPPQAVYQEGDVVEFTIRVTAHHRGHYEFRICDQVLDGRETGFSEAGGQDCLDEHVLLRADPDPSCEPDDANPDCQPIDPSHPGRWYVAPANSPMVHKMRYKLPSGLTCSRCTLQWYWPTANTCWYDGGYKPYFTKMLELGWSAAAWDPWAVAAWSNCENTCCNSNKFGEEFWNCADITIEGRGTSQTPQPTPQPTPSPTTVMQPTPSPTIATPSPTIATPSPTTATPSPPTAAPSPTPATTQPTPAPSTGPGVCQTLWGKCGGSGWQGPFCCTVGHICEIQDEWYSQCIPEPASGTAPSPATPEPTTSQQPAPTPAPAPSTACQAPWGKCAGSGWKGPFCCADGYACSFQSEWYSQCQPKASSLAEVSRQRKRVGAHAFLGKDHVMFQRLLQGAFRKRASAERLKSVENTKGLEEL